MKISVCGKGGSGKSTIVALLARQALEHGYSVLVVDSDESNSGLFRMFGFDKPPVPLMELVGGKSSVKQSMYEPNIFHDAEIHTDHIPEQYILRRDGLRLVAIGKIMQSLEGCACPMGVLNREFLKKLMLKPDEIAIVDTEAGVEHFGRGVETSIDSVLVVVEPPLESVNVASRVHALASQIGIKNIWALMNKVTPGPVSERLGNVLREQGIEVIGSIPHDVEIYNKSIEGKIPEHGQALQASSAIFDRLICSLGIPSR